MLLITWLVRITIHCLKICIVAFYLTDYVTQPCMSFFCLTQYNTSLKNPLIFIPAKDGACYAIEISGYSER